MLSSMMMSAPRVEASSTSASVRHSTSTGKRVPQRSRTRRTAAAMEPGAVHVVVLDEHHVVEALAVVLPAAHRDRVLGERPPPGEGLARVQDDRVPGIPRQRDQRPRGGGDPREEGDEVERRSLSAERRDAVFPRTPATRSPLRSAAPSCREKLTEIPGVDGVEHGGEDVLTGQHSCVLAPERGRALPVRDHGLRGDVARVTEVLPQGELDQRAGNRFPSSRKG